MSQDGRVPVATPNEAATVDGYSPEGATASARLGLAAGATIGKYRIESWLGGGGMGDVFKAYDMELRRFVALKFLQRDHPKLLARFIQEARAQARVDHPNICRVYEAGESDSRPYIAMQYVDGPTLDKAAREMSLEQKVRVVKQVADALHAAHRIGIIHRDVKPGNVMIEKTEDGQWIPYVMDFGLVRDLSAEGMTATGVMMGTPGYMSPEQIKGSEHELDRRTDVYGLGATLYDLLCERPPFSGNTSVLALVNVLDTDPEQPRKINARIPPDLETVVLKSLEREPTRRYDSARALADDLQRFLDGEPILARRSGFHYRLLKKARKNRAILTVTGIAVMAILLLGAYALRSTLNARAREESARRFGQQIKDIEMLARIGHLTPLHDVRREEAIIRTRMADFEEQIGGYGRGGEAPGWYAIGRGHLVFSEYDSAREYLQRAWDAGYHEPEVAFALGQTMGALYQRERLLAERLGSPDLKATRLKLIESEYRDPAMKFLGLSRGLATEAPEYLEALLAFYERRTDEALAKSEEAIKQAPWLYEAKVLQGAVHLSLGDAARATGDYGVADAAYAKSEEAYASASEIGHSDETVYEGIANLQLTRMEMTTYGQGGDVGIYFDKGVEACGLALRANPDSAEAHRLLSGLHLRIGEFDRDRGRDPTESLRKSIDSATEAARLKPDAINFTQLAMGHRTLATYLIAKNMDPTESVQQAQSAYESAIKIDSRYAPAHNNMGIAFRALGGYEKQRGLDPRSSLKRAIETYRKAIEINPEYSYAYNNIANSYCELASYELRRGLDPGAGVQEAIRACEKAIAINPNYAYPYNNHASALTVRARYELLNGMDPTQTVSDAVAAAERGEKVKAGHAALAGNIALALSTLAEYKWLRGEDPSPTVKNAIDAAERSLDLNPKAAGVQRELASVLLIDARYAVDNRRDPSAALRRSEEAIQRAMEASPGESESYVLKSEIAEVEAEWLAARGRDAAPAIARAKKALDESIAVRTDHAESHLAIARLSWLVTRGLSRLAVSAHEAEWLTAGLRAAEKALALNPSLAEAAVLQALLQLEELHARGQDGADAALRQAAENSLVAALARNRNIERLYKPAGAVAAGP